MPSLNEASQKALLFVHFLGLVISFLVASPFYLFYPPKLVTLCWIIAFTIFATATALLAYKYWSEN